MNTAAASVMSASASGPPILNSIRKTSAFLRKLSLNAEKNWHQNRGAKRRVISKDVDIVSDHLFGGPSYRYRPSVPFMNLGRRRWKPPSGRRLDARLTTSLDAFP